MKKKKKKLTKADLAPENFKSQEENEAAVEQYRTQTNYIQMFFGIPNKTKKIRQSGVPPKY
jgi:hypothetical protein